MIVLVKGGATQWASFSWISLLCLCLALLIVLASPNQHKKHDVLEIFYLPAFQLLLLFHVWTTIQQLSGISLDQAASLEYLFLGLGITALLYLWRIAFREQIAIHQLFISLIVFTTIQSVYGVWVFAKEVNLLLWMPKLHYLDRPTGFFVNANHFAAYLVLTIILILSRNITSFLRRPSSKPRSSLLVGLLDSIYNPYNLALCLLLFTLILTKSIGAITSLGVVLILMATHLAVAKKQLKVLVGVLSLGVTMLGLTLLAVDYEIVSQEINGLTHTFTRRLELSKAAMSMLSEHWLLGIGGGAFYSQFSPFRTLEVGNSYYNYAHNDWLQFWIEYGIIGIVILICFVAVCIRSNLKILRSNTSSMQRTFALASLYATAALAIHSLVDFPLHIPGFAASYLVIISVNSIFIASAKKTLF